MKTLTAVEGWVSNSSEIQGKYRNEQGIGLSGFYRRDYNDTSDMVVMGNDHSMLRYKYPKASNIPFHSSLVRWHNLFFCGGYSIRFSNGEQTDTYDRLFDAVRTGLKPTGFWPLTSEELEATLQKLKQTDLIWKVTINDHPYFQYEIGVAIKGKMKDHFDMNKLTASYQLFSKKLGYDLLSKKDEDIILSYEDVDLAWLLEGFDYGDPGKKNHARVLTGLILGYPIESTVALLTGRIY
ncbi:hypothetical protein MH215_23940 [Paenibacillus sp. ACRSA]|uniref:hypothetical protein n=1 Tax=Paenibacillus sp. ACRSA TaxID=2918211 RepID=UPI001EF6C4A2|nr:hypothetical protein [Paenibacillus sp. ACRSA]MCG7380050.1 hypothetical protein [Paenibacillus sp. ACRSA]